MECEHPCITWTDLPPELQCMVRPHLDQCAQACLAMTCHAEARAREPHGPRWVPLVFAATCDDLLAIVVEQHSRVATPYVVGYDLRLPKNTITLANTAAEHGSIHVLGWLLANGYQGLDNDLLVTAARHGQTAAMYLLMDSGGQLGKHVMEAAIEAKSIASVRWLAKRGCPPSFATAIRSGNIKAMKVMRAAGIPWPSHAYVIAGNAGNTACLEWLYCNSCPCDSDEWANLLYNLPTPAWMWFKMHRLAAPPPTQITDTWEDDVD